VALRRWLLALSFLSLLAAGAAGAGTIEGTVVRVVDGDTINVQLADRVEKIRYIGVNAPEIHHPIKGEEPGGRAAAQVNRGLVIGRRVRLELDVQPRDRYGRLLAYVWVGDTMVNAELVRLGYAQVMTVPPNVRYQDLFLKLQREARDASRGLWRPV
jgi:micrococcal nuclease